MFLESFFEREIKEEDMTPRAEVWGWKASRKCSLKQMGTVGDAPRGSMGLESKRGYRLGLSTPSGTTCCWVGTLFCLFCWGVHVGNYAVHMGFLRRCSKGGRETILQDRWHHVERSCSYPM